MFDNMKPYYSLDTYCKETFGEKLYKIALDAGFTCPNRDGSLDTRGCIFCSQGGSGDFASALSSPNEIRQALLNGRNRLSGKKTGSRYIAYFQAYTNTYGPISYLEAIYTAALREDFIAGISIATRPDCLPDSVLSLLAALKSKFPDKFIWVELGLQTIHEKTASFIRRGYPLSCFHEAVSALHKLEIPVIVHLILGLPGESLEDMLASVKHLNALPVWGIKLQLLHILEHTDLADFYKNSLNETGSGITCSFAKKEDYIQALIACIGYLRPDIVIHRVTGDAPRNLLLAPTWSSNKRDVLNTLHHTMKELAAYQGMYYVN